MLSTNYNRYVIVILFLIFSGGLTMPLLAVLAVGYPSHQTLPRGVPVLDSVFADLVETEPDPAMFPPYPVTESVRSITMKCDYNGLEQVNESSAVSIALDFISRVWYLSSINVSYDGAGGLDDGSWHLGFLGEDPRIIVNVNAISGKVNYFSSVWHIGNSPFIPDTNESRFASTTELEELAFDFLHQFNYSLSPLARYVGPTFAYDPILHHGAFVISFYNFVDGALIEDNGVHLFIDVEASAILRFNYRWVAIDTIPTERIISPGRAEQLAKEYLEGPMNLSEYEIRATALVFERMSTTPTGHEYRLGWIVSINSDFVASIHIDAKCEFRYNMDLFSCLDSDSPSGPFSPSILNLSPSQIILLLIGSALVALMASAIVRQRTMSYFSR